MDDLSCIVHYNARDAKYNKIKPVSSINKTIINAAKSLQESLGGVHHHKEQCDLIPETINETRNTPRTLLQKVYYHIVTKGCP